MARTVAAVALLVGLVGCEPAAEAPSGQLPAGFPAGFPLPPEAEIVSTGDVVVLRVADRPEDAANYFERALPAAGWEVTDRWQGTDPHGQPSFGMVIGGGDAAGALSFTPIEDGEGGVMVRINLRQPTVTSSGS